MKHVRELMLITLLLACSSIARADLFDRGNGLIYDDDLDITWLSDANYAGTSGFSGVYGVGGRMTWYEAIAWVDALNYGGYEDWRLPTTLQPDSSCSLQAYVDYGYCTGSELSHLFNVELGGILNTDVFAIGDQDLALFQNVFVGSDGSYWSATEYAPEPDEVAWVFNGSKNTQNPASKTNAFFVWAVRDGDVASVPEGIDIDVKPGDSPECGGVIPVAVLGSESLDVSQIDPSTLSFEGLSVKEKGNGALSCDVEDINFDGIADYVCQYRNGLTQGTLTGELLDGTPIEGDDSFCVKN